MLIVRANDIYNHSKPIELVDLDICPFTKFCHRNATAVLKEDLVPCCTPCSCSDNCWEQGNCCPDKDIIGHRVPELECVLTMVKETEPAGRIAYNGYTYGIKRYRIVTSCPNEEKNKTLVEKCASHNKTSILDYTWVTDESTGRIYQNEHCARCHAVDRYFKWQIRTTYSPALLANFSSLPNIIHSRHCELMVELPDDKVHLADKYRCYKADRAECNITGLWRDYDASVDLACRTYSSPIVTYIQKSLMYKNIYCYYCNGLKGQQFAQSCPNLSDGRNGILSKSFSALIDFTERQPSGVASLCSQNEIFDILILSMINHAPIQKILTDGVQLFLVDEGREDPNTTIRGPSPVYQRNVI